jgi:hypothetical protein
VKERDIARPCPLLPFGSRPGRRIRIHWERQELLLGSPPQRPRHPRIEEPDNGLEHTIRSEGVASMNPENALIEAEHDRAVGMSEDAVDISETEHG